MVRLNVQPPVECTHESTVRLQTLTDLTPCSVMASHKSTVWSVLLDQQNKYFVNFGTVQQQFSTSKTGRILPGRCHHRLAAAEERPPLEGIRQVYLTFNVDDKKRNRQSWELT